MVAALYCLFFAYVGMPLSYSKQNSLLQYARKLILVFLCCHPIWAGSAGLGFLQFCNLNSFRTKFILGFSVFMGLSIPHYFNEYTAVNGYGPVHTHARWVSKTISSLLMVEFLKTNLGSVNRSWQWVGWLVALIFCRVWLTPMKFLVSSYMFLINSKNTSVICWENSK